MMFSMEKVPSYELYALILPVSEQDKFTIAHCYVPYTPQIAIIGSFIAYTGGENVYHMTLPASPLIEVGKFCTSKDSIFFFELLKSIMLPIQ